MKYSVSALVLGFFTALSAAAPTPDTDGLDPSQVAITGSNYGGSGCPAGSATISHSPDFQSLTIIFDHYEPAIGPGTKISEHIKNCNLNVQIRYPADYQYAIYKTDYTGYAWLDKGVTAKQTSSYWFAGFVGDKPTFQSTWYGPYDGLYTFTDTIASPLYSPCGGSSTLNINTQLVMTSSNPKAQNFSPEPDLDTKALKKYQHTYGVNWRKCH